MSEITWRYVKTIKNEKSIDEFESKFCALPKDLLECMRQNNGGRPSLSSFDLKNEKEKEFKTLLSFNEDDVENIFEAQNLTKKEGLFPFASDPFGNHLCLYQGKIVFWNHETDDTEILADNFSEFLQKLY